MEQRATDTTQSYTDHGPFGWCWRTKRGRRWRCMFNAEEEAERHDRDECVDTRCNLDLTNHEAPPDESACEHRNASRRRHGRNRAEGSGGSYRIAERELIQPRQRA